MRIHDTLKPEFKDRVSQYFLTMLAVGMLYWGANQDVQPAKAQEYTPAIVGSESRITTILESGPFAKLRNESDNSICTATLATSINTDVKKGSRAFITAFHCLKSQSADGLLNPNYIRISVINDGLSKEYRVAKILRPTVEGKSDPDLAVVLVNELIPIIGDLNSVEFGNDDQIPPKQLLSTVGFGVQKDNTIPNLPIITEAIAIDTDSINGCADVPNWLVTVPSETHVTQGDSGGFLGYIYEGVEGETKFKQIGVAAAFCSDLNSSQVSTSFESLESAEIQQELIDIIDTANQQEYLDPIPFTNTQLRVDGLGESLNAYSEGVLSISADSPQIESLTFYHDQDPKLNDVSVSLTDVTYSSELTNDCLEISQQTPVLPLVFENGKNPSVTTTFAVNSTKCGISPFQSKVTRMLQRFSLSKRTGEQELSTQIERAHILKIFNSLKISVETLTELPTVIYEETTSKGLISIEARKSGKTIELTISTPQYLPYLHYTLLDLADSSLSSTTTLQIPWSGPEISSAVPITKKILISLPEEKVYLPNIQNLE